MSFGVGIGDIWLLLEKTIELYNAIKDAPPELAAAMRDCKLMEQTLKAVKEQIGDEKQFVKRFETINPELAPQIQQTLKPTREDVKVMKKLLKRYRDAPKNILRDFTYVLMYKSDLRDLRDEFSEHISKLNVALSLIHGVSQEESKAQFKKNLKDEMTKLKKENEMQNKKMQEANRKERDKDRKTIAESIAQQMDKAPTQLSPKELIEALKRDLVAKGISPQIADEFEFPITKALLKEPLPSMTVPKIKVEKSKGSDSVQADGKDKIIRERTKSDTNLKKESQPSAKPVPGDLGVKSAENKGRRDSTGARDMQKSASNTQNENQNRTKTSRPSEAFKQKELSADNGVKRSKSVSDANSKGDKTIRIDINPKQKDKKTDTTAKSKDDSNLRAKDFKYTTVPKPVNIPKPVIAPEPPNLKTKDSEWKKDQQSNKNSTKQPSTNPEKTSGKKPEDKPQKQTNKTAREKLDPVIITLAPPSF